MAGPSEAARAPSGGAVLRFAPSPNGYLHLGHAYSALLNDRVARRLGGRWLLRIEDIDQARATPEKVAALGEDLAWLGLDWQRPERRQSEHFEIYRDAAATLRARGLLYPCFCSRTAIAGAVAAIEARTGMAAPRDPDGSPLYPGTCRAVPAAEAATRIARGVPHGWRLDAEAARDGVADLTWMTFDPARLGRTARFPASHAEVAGEAGPRSVHDRSSSSEVRLRRIPQDEVPGAFGPGSQGDGFGDRESGSDDAGLRRVPVEPERWGDVVLVRRDVPTSYHLSVVVDDAIQGITHVVRGRDLEAATDIHALLARRLDLPSPRYHHHRLLVDDGGRKLAKSRDSTSLRAMRAAGVTAEAIRRRLGFA